MVALNQKSVQRKLLSGEQMLAVVKAARTLIETGSIISKVISVRGGYKRRYVTYYLNVSNLPNLFIKKKFKVKVKDSYIDYIVDPNGEYSIQRRGGSYYIRFPIPYRGPVLIIPLEEGFRVYLLK